MYTRAFEYYCQNAIKFLLRACSYVYFSDSVITRKETTEFITTYIEKASTLSRWVSKDLIILVRY